MKQHVMCVWNSQQAELCMWKWTWSWRYWTRA